jgi:ZipA, C-terminal FtsZ-binding domain
MTDLQLAMIGVGVALVGGVAIFNVVQERRARKGAEKAFGERPPDALFDDAGNRREPTLGRLPDAADAVAVEAPAPPAPDAADLEAGVAPTAEISSRIDTVAVILADDPVTREQLDPLIEALRDHATPVHVEGIVEEQSHPIDSSPKSSWRELRVALQLASRRGPVTEDEIETFNRAVADFSAGVNAVSQREAPVAAAQRAHELDRFCAEADIEVAVNVIGQFGATFALARVKAIALDHGLSETAEGALVSFALDGSIEFAVRRFGDEAGRAATTYVNGLTLALDLPQVADAAMAFANMVQLAQTIAATLGGQLVDDNRRPLTDAGLASIARTVEKVCGQMQAHGIPAGSALARRLFS